MQREASSISLSGVTACGARVLAVALVAACAVSLGFSCPPASADDEEKVETPVIEKEVEETYESGATGWQDVADVQVGESVSFRLTGSLPSNWDEFSSYLYEFHDEIPDGLEADASTVSVALVSSDGEATVSQASSTASSYAHAAACSAASRAAVLSTAADETSTDVTSSFEVSLDGGSLQISCDDLKAAAPSASYGDTVVVTYEATLSPGAATGASGEYTGAACLEYTSKTWTTARGQSLEDSATVVTWELSLAKVAEGTGEALEGAVFTVQNADGSYVASDGTLSDSAVELSCGECGLLSVSGLDSGSYTVEEVAAPDGYDAVGSFTLDLDSDTVADPVTLSASASADFVTLVSADADAGTVSATVEDPESASSVSSGAGTAASEGGSSGSQASAPSDDSTSSGFSPSTGDMIRAGFLALLVVALVAVLAARRARKVRHGEGDMG